METQTYKNLVNKPKNNDPQWLIIHHGGGTDLNPLADTSHHTAQMMEAWHLAKVPPWDGLGYQYVIHKDGAVWKGRPEHRNGAHTVTHNTKSIGICLSGNFDATLPTQPQIDSLKKLLIEKMVQYKISTEKIVPHRKFATKTCYGKKLSDTWAADLTRFKTESKEEIKAKIKALVDQL